ncbi:polyphosphate kinase 2 family protein [Candidatus Jorgensenbacteria bacterium]|nr:polyphosphate kinase 2 family protein [Candidatus Jorgensenbacteria bacterium]
MNDSDLLVKPGELVKLKKLKTDSWLGFKGKKDSKKFVERRALKLGEYQNLLYAQGRYGVLVIVQAMDAAGKDTCVRNVFSEIDPHGFNVVSFKRPSEEALNHDWIWRHTPHLPARGHITVWNRSWYEEMVVVRVHPEFLAKQNLPPETMNDIWTNRFRDINNFEEYLTRNGIVILKFFLHLSKSEQTARFTQRIEIKEKNYKFSAGDIGERLRWKEYMKAYEAVLSKTSTKHAPWYVVPADHKWVTRAAVADIVVKRLKRMKLRYPVIPLERRRELLVLKDDLKHK